MLRCWERRFDQRPSPRKDVQKKTLQRLRRSETSRTWKVQRMLFLVFQETRFRAEGSSVKKGIHGKTTKKVLLKAILQVVVMESFSKATSKPFGRWSELGVKVKVQEHGSTEIDSYPSWETASSSTVHLILPWKVQGVGRQNACKPLTSCIQPISNARPKETFQCCWLGRFSSGSPKPPGSPFDPDGIMKGDASFQHLIAFHGHKLWMHG